MKIVSNKKEIRYCQKQLERKIKSNLSPKGEINIGYPGGSMMNSVWANDEFWFSSFEITDPNESTPRFWNGFGVAAELSETKSNNIAVEINIPTQGINKMVAGFFVITEKQEIYLFHRGRVGGGRAGIGKKAFLSWYPQETEKAFGPDGNADYGIKVGDITSEYFLEDLAKFIKNVSLFREIATSGAIDKSTYLSNEELKKKAREDEAGKKPKKIQTKTSSFERNPFIAELAKRHANGICQLCEKPAPFKNRLGRPYLETHHIIWLADGGMDSISNTVALCPNCHKKMHILNLEKDINILKIKANKL